MGVSYNNIVKAYHAYKGYGKNRKHLGFYLTKEIAEKVADQGFSQSEGKASSVPGIGRGLPKKDLGLGLPLKNRGSLKWKTYLPKEIPAIDRRPGVYVLIINGHVHYIGSGSRVADRIKAHFWMPNIKVGKHPSKYSESFNVYLKIRYFSHIVLAKDVESKLIWRLKPYKNVADNYMPHAKTLKLNLALKYLLKHK